jgi:2-keto-4-pentenoate hydratase
MTTAEDQVWASRLETAWTTREAIEPITDSDPAFDVVGAYAAQQTWARARAAAGETVLGIKIGLTSRSVQEQMNVSEPDYGLLWGSRYCPSIGGRAAADHSLFIAPRVEGELAFLLGDVPTGDRVTAQQVLAATEAVAPAIEIVDSRIRDWRIRLPDTVADNASYGGFTVGPWSRSLISEDLQTLGMQLNVDGSERSAGIGGAALGHPAAAVAWLLSTLNRLGATIAPGSIVLSGALGPMVAAEQGMSATLHVHGQPPLTLMFE